jgi:hypothetical protein
MLVQQFSLPIDFNGIVIFSYPDIDRWYNGIRNGQNILKDFIETDIGDKVMDEGLVVPVVNIDDGDYLIRIFYDEPFDQGIEVVFLESGFPMKISNSIFCADVAVFWDWEEYLGWNKINIQPGFYSVDARGVKHLREQGNHIPGYDFIFKKLASLPMRTAKTRSDSRIFR